MTEHELDRCADAAERVGPMLLCALEELARSCRIGKAAPGQRLRQHMAAAELALELLDRLERDGRDL